MSRDYKDEYDKFQDSPRQLKKRAALNRINHNKGTYGNDDGLDVSHTNDGIRFEKSSINKGRKEKSRMKGRENNMVVIFKVSLIKMEVCQLLLEVRPL